MSSAAEILVIILAIVLSIFLIVAIILFIYLIRLSDQIRKMTETVHRTVGHVEDAVEGAAKLLSPTFVAMSISNSIKKFMNKAKKG